MRRWAKGLIIAALAGGVIVAAVGIYLLPAIIGFALAVAGAIGWTRRLDDSARPEPVHVPDMAVPASSPAIETLYVFGQTREGTRRAMAEAARLAGDRPVRLLVFVIEPGRTGVPIDHQTVAALRQHADSPARTTTVISCVCRRAADVTRLLPAESTVVIERVGPDWWPTFNRRLAIALKRSGCRVALA